MHICFMCTHVCVSLSLFIYIYIHVASCTYAQKLQFDERVGVPSRSCNVRMAAHISNVEVASHFLSTWWRRHPDFV